MIHEPLILTNVRCPQSYREGAFGLGAGKWRTIRTVVLPGCVDGVLTGCILAVGRLPVSYTHLNDCEKADLLKAMLDEYEVSEDRRTGYPYAAAAPRPCLAA